MTSRYTVKEFLCTYGSWQSMMQRMVYKTRRSDHGIYRGRGVKMCERWRSFENFIADMGPRKDRTLSLDRFPDMDGDYKPGNCRWATARQQAANTRSAVILSYMGESLPIAEWSRRTGLSRGTIQLRLKMGWSLKKSLTTAPHDLNPAYVTFAEGRKRGKKLTSSNVKELVRLAKSGTWTASRLGLKYGVSGSAVSYIAKQFGVKFKRGRPKK